jgi:hypothetical protein
LELIVRRVAWWWKRDHGAAERPVGRLRLRHASEAGGTCYLAAVAGRGGDDRLKAEQPGAGETVADQVDAAADLADRVPVVAGEVLRNANQSRRTPQHLGRGRNPEPVADQGLELRPVIDQPGQVEQPLGDHSGVTAPLVLHDHRRPVLIDPQGINPPAVHGTRAVLARQEAHTQQRQHVRLDQPLQISLELQRLRHNLYRVSSTQRE